MSTLLPMRHHKRMIGMIKLGYSVEPSATIYGPAFGAVLVFVLTRLVPFIPVVTGLAVTAGAILGLLGTGLILGRREARSFVSSHGPEHAGRAIAYFTHLGLLEPVDNERINEILNGPDAGDGMMSDGPGPED